jgi:hypothetical protein
MKPRTTGRYEDVYLVTCWSGHVSPDGKVVAIGPHRQFFSLAFPFDLSQ